MTTNKELFVCGFAKLLEEEQQVGVQLKEKDSDESILDHRLSAKSEVFKKMMESDKIKTSAKLETITFSELYHFELEALVEFIYSDGSKLSAKGKHHAMWLYVAANKYEIPHLRDLCRIALIQCLNNSTIAFGLLDLAQIPFDKAIYDAAFGYIKELKNI